MLASRKVETKPGVLGLVSGAVIALGLVVFSSVASFAQDESKPVKLVALGDSLTAGYQLPPEDAFPVKLEKALQEKGYNVTVVNAGVSGDTTSGGLSRLDWSVGDDVDGVILELGANDALRGLDPSSTRKNLDTMLERLGTRGIPVLIAGMQAPPNMGSEFGQEFNALYGELAERHGVLFYPFFLDGVAAQPELNLGDGIHPTGEGVSIIVEKILPSVELLIKRTKS
ncbi:Arylesterase precursor [Pseudovibrio axinellae]|uniref:Arylesterase n=1 Tax=Pseudovibrio axinellae TaxID=989403 RepID=A0A165WY60_9HYPH|nr:arylesterase [Pseudovibrio axinellae]KZL17030.1 Arylesterase precursor [Pseudovibrio axinellae]SEQ16809.1 (3S)-malyl-CoA thioesterase [Pseudovibrio axinellae]